MVQSKRKKNETGLLYLCHNGMIWLDGKGGGGGGDVLGIVVLSMYTKCKTIWYIHDYYCTALNNYHIVLGNLGMWKE